MKKKKVITLFLIFAVIIFGVVAFTSWQNKNASVVQVTSQKTTLPDFSGAEKLKLGIRELIFEYETKRVEAALLFAQKDIGLDCQGEKCFVHVLTKGNASDNYRNDFEKIGISETNTSSLNNIASGYLTFEEIKSVAGQDFVHTIQPPDKLLME